MALALLPKQLIEVDLSDNAFGPDGIKAFECLLREDRNLRVLKVTNCGLGPEGGQMIAEALSKNEGLKLTHFHAGRDRLENKGISALASVFKQMGSLLEIHVPQNGIKDEGMKELIAALTSCKQLHTARVNDNWLKTESTEQLLALFIACKSLKELNISDGNMGTANVVAALRALKKSGNSTIEMFSCNYNDVESQKMAGECLEVLSTFETLRQVEFIGNVQSKKWNRDWAGKFKDMGKDLKWCDEEDDDEEDEDEEHEEDDQHEDALA
jgi:Ran GTPase-activating protein 1